MSKTIMPKGRAQGKVSTISGKPRIAGVILAAGQSRRMGSANKLLSKLNNQSFIQKLVDSAIASNLNEITVITGHEADLIKYELSSVTVNFAHNCNFSEGLSSSLKVGIEALGTGVDAALILLSDMPFISERTIDAIIAQYEQQNRCIIVPYHQGQRGSPVLWPRHYFAELMSLTGDQGARQLLKTYRDAIYELELGDEILIDVDTPEEAAVIGVEIHKETLRNDTC